MMNDKRKGLLAGALRGYAEEGDATELSEALSYFIDDPDFLRELADELYARAEEIEDETDESDDESDEEE